MRAFWLVLAALTVAVAMALCPATPAHAQGAPDVTLEDPVGDATTTLPPTSASSSSSTTAPTTTQAGTGQGSTTSTSSTATSSSTASTTSTSTTSAPNTSTPQTTSPGAGGGDEPPDSGQGGPGGAVEPEAPAPGPQPDPPGADVDGPGMSIRIPGRPSSVRSSNIPIGSIVLASLVMLFIGAAAVLSLRREPRSIKDTATFRSRIRARLLWLQQVITQAKPDQAGPFIIVPAGKVETLNLLLELGETLLDSGTAVPQVETTLKAVAETFGIGGLEAIVLPNSLVLSLPDDNEIRTGAGTAGSRPLRLDQIDDLTHVVRQLVRGQLTVQQAHRSLERIRSSPGPVESRRVVLGHALTAAGLVMILGGTWKEVLIGSVFGTLIGLLLMSTRQVENIAYIPFQPLVVAAVGSTAVFALTRFISGLIVFPLLIAPLITLLPGAKLTMGVLELVTGHIVAGTSRVMSGAMQLVLLGLGLAAGATLVGAGGGVRTSTASGWLAAIAPWVGVALFGSGIVRVNGAFQSSRRWILVVLYVAYAGQVIGALFFGPSLSAFFGALAMTPIAVLASRQARGPSPLVTFLPAFWILVPGALGLRGVSLLLGTDGGGENTLLVALTSMIGISLGILLGLTMVTNSRSSWWIGDVVPAGSRVAAGPAVNEPGSDDGVGAG